MNGQFSLKSAYNECRIKGVSLSSCRYIWWSGIHQSAKIFMWKLLYRALSLSENLTAFTVAFPIICPFCRQTEGIIDHIFVHCPAISSLWRKYAVLFNGPLLFGHHYDLT